MSRLPALMKTGREVERTVEGLQITRYKYLVDMRTYM